MFSGHSFRHNNIVTMWHSVYFSSMFLLVNSSPFTTLVTMIGQQFHFYSGWLQAKATNQVTNWWEFIVNLVFISTAIISLPLFIQAWIPRSYPKVVKQLDNFVEHWPASKLFTQGTWSPFLGVRKAPVQASSLFPSTSSQIPPMRVQLSQQLTNHRSGMTLSVDSLWQHY